MTFFFFFFFNDTATTEIYTLSLHDALPIYDHVARSRIEADVALDIRDLHVSGTRVDAERPFGVVGGHVRRRHVDLQIRSEEHTSELQSRPHLVCRLLLEKKKKHRGKHPSSA